ncbi:MAG: hypothetical protein IJX04_00050 [Oscillospiraceae bacterium]|nr:hypothetical protein [Oscillospiraceae bacterium]
MIRVNYGQEIPVRIEVLTHANERMTRYFFCGNPAIDEYFRCFAADDATAVTYLVIDENNQKLLAALTIACSAIFLSKKQQFSTLMSAIEVVYFAVDVDYQGLRYRPGDDRSLSHYLFSYLIEMIRGISRDHVGAAKIVLYSVPEAFNFYRRLGFSTFGSTMYGDRGTFVKDCVPMYFDLN